MKTVLRFLRSRTLSPAGLTSWSLLILATLAVTHLLGFRESVTILTGTVPVGSSLEATGLKAIVYMAAYFASVLLLPPMLLTAAVVGIRQTLSEQFP